MIRDAFVPPVARNASLPDYREWDLIDDACAFDSAGR